MTGDARRLWSPSRRDLVLGGALAATGAIAATRMPRRKIMAIGPSQLDTIVPFRIGAWRYQTQSGLVLPPPDQLAQLTYDQQVTRTYVSSDDLPVMLLMAYGSSQSGAIQVHRPEICYPASGFQLTRTREEDLPLGLGRVVPVRRFTAASDTRIEQVMYWTRIGGLLPVSWAAQRMAVVRSNLAGNIPDGLLVRMSTIFPDERVAQATLERFARTMLASVSPTGRRMLIADI